MCPTLRQTRLDLSVEVQEYKLRQRWLVFCICPPYVIFVLDGATFASLRGLQTSDILQRQAKINVLRSTALYNQMGFSPSLILSFIPVVDQLTEALMLDWLREH